MRSVRPIFSQCRDRRMGEMWLDLGALTTARAREKATAETRAPILTQNTSNEAIPGKCLVRVAKPISKVWTPFSKKPRHFGLHFDGTEFFSPETGLTLVVKLGGFDDILLRSHHTKLNWLKLACNRRHDSCYNRCGDVYDRAQGLAAPLTLTLFCNHMWITCNTYILLRNINVDLLIYIMRGCKVAVVSACVCVCLGAVSPASIEIRIRNYD